MLTDLMRRDPIGDLGALRSDMERLMERSRSGGTLPRRWAPTSDVIETEDAIVITAELPGVKDADVHITVQNGILRISGERRLEEEGSEGRFHRLERSYGGFERSFMLPAGVSEGDITAGVAYGVLKISIPKPSGAEPRVIAINPGG